MIKLLYFVLLIVPLFGETTRFTFPDHHSRFLYFAQQSMKNSSQIIILSNTLNHAVLKKMLQSAAKSGTEVTLYLHTPNKDPLSLIQYRGIELFLTRTHLKQSVILIDETILCTTAEEIDEERFYESTSSMYCSTDPNDAVRLKPWIQAIRNYSTPYLND